MTPGLLRCWPGQAFSSSLMALWIEQQILSMSSVVRSLSEPCGGLFGGQEATNSLCTPEDSVVANSCS